MPQNITLEEFDIENEDDLLQNIDSFDQAVIWGTDWTTETINNQLNRKNIDLFPNFKGEMHGQLQLKVSL
ncbi:hypothetical protein ACFOEQ_09810 [Chryseobacterium arachidis]|uniref:hypothetical protein n=1 Tax=Chryseobacterium arachidis TaxID=1416778 RepID=UPI00360FC337